MNYYLEAWAEAWAPICAKMSGEVGIRFEVASNGGGTMAILGEFGPLRIRVTDWEEGDLSGPDHVGYWVGFELPDAGWTGRVESLVGDPDCTAASLPKLVAFAVSGYLRGERYGQEAFSGYSRNVPTTDGGTAVIAYE